MGVISDLVRMKSEKDAAAKQGTIDALKLVMMPDSGATPEARNYAQTSLVNLLEGEFGGGKGKSGGGGKDKAGVSGFFSHLLNGLGNINPYGASSGTKQQVSQVRQGMPSKMFLTDEEKEALRAKQAKIESDEQAKAAAFKKQEDDRVAREDNQRAYEQEYDRGVKSLGLSPSDAAKRADEIVNKYKPAAAPKQSAPKAVTAIGPDGKTFTAYLRTDENGVEQLYKLGSDKPLDPTQYAQAEKPQQADASEKLVYTNAAGDEIPVFRDPHSNKMYDEAGNAVDVAALKLKGYKLQGKAEPRDTGELGQREEALKILSDPNSTKEQIQAATDTLKSLDTKQKGAENRLIIQTNQATNARQGEQGAYSDEELRALAETGILTGKDPAFGLSANNPDRRKYYKIKADLMLGKGPAETAATAAQFKGSMQSLNSLQKLRGNIVSFEGTAQKNLDQALSLSDKVGRTGSSLANEFLLNAQGKLADYPLLSQFKVAVRTAAFEYARVVNSATGGGVSTEAARKDAEDMINTAMAKGSFRAAAQQMKTDMKNRTDSIDETIKGLRDSLSNTNLGGNSQPSASGASTSDSDPLGILK